VLCATRGEAGESRVETDDLAALRERELRAAAELLGIATVVVLDHRDSGIDGEAASGTLIATPLDVVAAEIRSVVDDLRPDVVVTLDASDGHRDHAHVRDATLMALDGAAHRPVATYLWCLARSSMQRWADHVRRRGGGDAYLGVADLGTPDAEITTVLDVRDSLARRWAAIRAHASQASPYDDLPADLQLEFLATDRLRLVEGTDVLAAIAR
jgi:N-acetyl-1-D-myo-inositol-2-amino-2-deoxy-alpha-D-glucopyranoside deacetylase